MVVVVEVVVVMVVVQASTSASDGPLVLVTPKADRKRAAGSESSDFMMPSPKLPKSMEQAKQKAKDRATAVLAKFRETQKEQDQIDLSTS